MKKCAIIGIFMILTASGCTTVKEWTATGGSRSDGVVRLSYQTGEFESPKVNELQGTQLASKRCATWGYSGAEAFGGTVRQCSMTGGFSGCSMWTITKEYQCTGQGNETQKALPAGMSPSAAARINTQVTNGTTAHQYICRDEKGEPYISVTDTPAKGCIVQ